MGLYSSFMDINEVIEYLNKNTDREFNPDKVIKFIDDNNIPLLFKYTGYITYRVKGEPNRAFIMVSGTLKVLNNETALQAFKTGSDSIAIHEAMIYDLDSYQVRNKFNLNCEVKPKLGDAITFETGGVDPVGCNQDLPDFVWIEADTLTVLKADIDRLSGIQADSSGSSLVGIPGVKRSEPKSDKETIDEQKARIADLENKLKQAQAKQSVNQADDLKAVPHQSYRTVDRIMYAMAKLSNKDNSSPTSQNTGSLNSAITTILHNDGIPLEYEAVGKWLKRVSQIKPIKN